MAWTGRLSLLLLLLPTDDPNAELWLAPAPNGLFVPFILHFFFFFFFLPIYVYYYFLSFFFLLINN